MPAHCCAASWRGLRHDADSGFRARLRPGGRRGRPELLRRARSACERSIRSARATCCGMRSPPRRDTPSRMPRWPPPPACWDMTSKRATKPRKRWTSRPDSGAKSTFPSKGRISKPRTRGTRPSRPIRHSATNFRTTWSTACGWRPPQTQAGEARRGAADHSLAARPPLRRPRSAGGPCGGRGVPRRFRSQIRPRCGGARRAIRHRAGHAHPGGPRAPDRKPHRAGIRRSAELAFGGRTVAAVIPGGRTPAGCSVGAERDGWSAHPARRCGGRPRALRRGAGGVQNHRGSVLHRDRSR